VGEIHASYEHRVLNAILKTGGVFGAGSQGYFAGAFPYEDALRRLRTASKVPGEADVLCYAWELFKETYEIKPEKGGLQVREEFQRPMTSR